MEKITVTDLEKALRVDKYLNMVQDELSRSFIQQLIDDEKIVINDKPCKSNTKVKNGDIITINDFALVEIDAKPEDIPLDIIYEDQDIIVINKPKGMVVHPSIGNYEHTLVNALLFHCKDLSGINGKIRPGIVHRIDKDTTGCIVACKNDKAHEAIAQQLANKTCHREYMALVEGVIEHNSGTIDAPIGRDGKDRKKMTVTEINSKEAITHFDVIERFKKYTLVKCKLETGRTHQIRVHMQFIDHPIVGDEVYGRRKTLKNTQGQVLHAYKLELIHPTTLEKMTFEAPLPTYFTELLTSIRSEDNA
ncbi:MAG: RluA family pseudouridine synthase [Erysipelotrichaceae bacterium]|nr:RluA family pseudouridine synthase [Erysipelotrichaceae bacterium]MDY5252341.1 RluA family pseudouridine synthase [Erysipelotrichaceae bacterium]